MTESEKPVFLTDHEEYQLRMDRVDTFPPGNECYVSVVVEGLQFEGIVPLGAILNDSARIVSGMRVGSVGQKIIITFSPSSLGTSTWTMLPEHAEKIRVAG